MSWLLTLAAAAPLVFDPAGTDPSGADALDRAREAGLQGELEPLSLGDVRQAQPWSRNGQPIRPCNPGEVDAAAVRGHLLYGEFDAAMERIATERLRCGGPPSARGALEQAAGVLALQRGDESKARRAFALARGYDPDLVWDDGYAPDGRPLFEAAEPALAELVVVPPPLSVDGGAPVEGPLAAGPHGVSVGGLELHIQHSTIDDVLAVPQAYPATLPDLSDEEARRQLTYVLSAAVGPGKRVHVAAPDALYTGTTGRTDWTALPWPAPEPVEPPVAVVTRRSPAPWIVAGVGALVAGGGGLLAGLSSQQAHRIAGQLDEPQSQADFDALTQDGHAANGRVVLGQGLLGGGVAIAGGGVLWGVLR